MDDAQRLRQLHDCPHHINTSLTIMIGHVQLLERVLARSSQVSRERHGQKLAKVRQASHTASGHTRELARQVIDIERRWIEVGPRRAGPAYRQHGQGPTSHDGGTTTPQRYCDTEESH